MLAQVLAVIIFVAMFILVVTEVVEKHYITLGAAVLTIVGVFLIGGAVSGNVFGPTKDLSGIEALIETLNVKSIFTSGFWYKGAESASGINWATIIFLFGMMVMVEGMARVGFFRWLCMELAKMVKYKVIPLFLAFMILSAILAMFIDSITVILFLAAVTIELSQLLKFNPVPMILAEIFCANLGGSATMCGDPPNIIIGTAMGYSFADFLVNTGLIAGLCLIFVVIYFYFIFRKQLVQTEEVDTSTMPDPKSAILDKKGFAISCVIFAIAVVLLVTHSMTELTVATIGVGVAILTVVTAPKHIGEIMKGVDFKTLGFFVGLFVVVGGLEQTGILEVIASAIGKVAGGNMYLMIAIIIWVSAICSAFVDNIPFAATMVPIISSLAGGDAVMLKTLSWTLAMGTDIGGSATPIGASANVVGVAKANEAGHIIKWGKYCKAMAPATIIVIAVSMLMIFVRYVGF